MNIGCLEILHFRIAANYFLLCKLTLNFLRNYLGKLRFSGISRTKGTKIHLPDQNHKKFSSNPMKKMVHTQEKNANNNELIPETLSLILLGRLPVRF